MEKDKFEFTYSAPTKEERAEIEDIRKDYIEKTDAEIKLDKLKTLDKRVKVLPKVLAYIFGIAGILVFGLGLTLILEWESPVWGSIVGVIGCLLMSINYLIYKKIKFFMIKKYKAKIILLSDELLNEK